MAAEVSEKRTVFWLTYLVSTFVGIFMLISICDWAIMYKRKGDHNDSAVVVIEIAREQLGYPSFGYHPLLMTLSLIFVLGQNSIIFVLFPDQPVARTKIYHLIGMSVVALLAVLGLNAAFSTTTEHIRNPHDVAGLITTVLFGVQFVSGFLVKFYPGGTREVMKRYKPLHNFLGILVFVFATATALSGRARITQSHAHNGSNGDGSLYAVCLLCYTGLTLILLASRNFSSANVLPQSISHPPVAVKRDETDIDVADSND